MIVIHVKILKILFNDIGIYDKMLQSKSISKSFSTENVETSEKDNKTTKISKLPSIPEIKSEGKKTFEKNITNN